MKARSLWEPYVAGVLHGDGWCTDLTIGLRAVDPDFVLRFYAAVCELAPRAHHPLVDERGYWLFRTSNKSGRFSKLRAYQPNGMIETAAWLRGLFDSEGNANLWHMKHISPNSYDRRIAMYSTDMSTIEIACNMLSKLGVSHSTRNVRHSATHMGTKPVTELRIVRRSGLERFVSLVGFSIFRKQKVACDIVESYLKSEGFASRGGKESHRKHPDLRKNLMHWKDK